MKNKIIIAAVLLFVSCSSKQVFDSATMDTLRNFQTVSPSPVIVAIPNFQIKSAVIPGKYSTAAAESLSSRLVKMKGYSVIERKRVNDVFNENSFDRTILTSDEARKRISETLSAQYLFLGEISFTFIDRKKTYIFNIDQVNITNGVIENNFSINMEKLDIDLLNTRMTEAVATNLVRFANSEKLKVLLSKKFNIRYKYEKPAYSDNSFKRLSLSIIVFPIVTNFDNERLTEGLTKKFIDDLKFSGANVLPFDTLKANFNNLDKDINLVLTDMNQYYKELELRMASGADVNLVLSPDIAQKIKNSFHTNNFQEYYKYYRQHYSLDDRIPLFISSDIEDTDSTDFLKFILTYNDNKLVLSKVDEDTLIPASFLVEILLKSIEIYNYDLEISGL